MSRRRRKGPPPADFFEYRRWLDEPRFIIHPHKSYHFDPEWLKAHETFLDPGIESAIGELVARVDAAHAMYAIEVAHQDLVEA